MEELILEQINKFINDFALLYKTDGYISKKKYDSFLDQYSDIIENAKKYEIEQNEQYLKFYNILNKGYEMIEIRNNKYVEYHLNKEKEYFDNMFKAVDENIVLDEEQRRAILIDEDYSLIVAGAGAGKTTTMAAKVKYLVERKNVKPNSIILLSFTNKAVDELNRLINDEFKLNVDILTFHKLGMKFLRNTSSQRIEIIDDNGIYAVLRDYFKNYVFTSKNLLQEYMESFKEYLILDENCLKYVTYDEYYQHYMDEMYERDKDNLSEVVKARIERRLKNGVTIKGERVRSTGEVRIANYLFKNGIKYAYEKPYDFKLINNKSYKPDFTIDNGDYPIYLEYFGLSKLYNDGRHESASIEYNREIELKRATHKKNSTDLIEIYGSYEDGQFFMYKLGEQINKRNLKRFELSDKDIYYELLSTSRDFKFMNLLKLFILFIDSFKQKGYVYEKFDELIDKCDDEKVKKQLSCIKGAFEYYESTIRKMNRIDFNDMINYAYRSMDVLKENRKDLNYNYVIVDEYQDISFQRFNFIRRISDLFDAKIVAVGDDWQTIFSFSGSDINLFTRFNEMMGYSEQIKIINTYRNSQELIDLAGDFVLKNKYQIEKQLHSNKHLNKPVKLIEYEFGEMNDMLPERLERLISDIYNKYPDDNILLLARFNDELQNLLTSKLFFKNSMVDSSIKCKSVPNAKIDFLTVHKSKGLGYDRVIILNGIDATRGFPSKIKDADIIKYLRNEYYDDVEDYIEYPEERRLFYVALTRTKNELYIMTPSNYQYRSEFVKEIEDNENVSIEK